MIYFSNNYIEKGNFAFSCHYISLVITEVSIHFLMYFAKVHQVAKIKKIKNMSKWATAYMIYYIFLGMVYSENKGKSSKLEVVNKN